MPEEEQEAFAAFVTGDAPDREKGRIFHLKRNNGEYRLNIVRVIGVDDDKDNGRLYNLETIDVFEAIYINDKAVIDEEKVRLLLGMTDEYMFSYSRHDNLFMMFHYDGIQKILLYRMDVDDWKKEMMDSGYVPDDEEPKLDLLISKMKSYSDDIEVNLTCGIRTLNDKAMEDVCFRGLYFDADDDAEKAVIGRVLTAASNDYVNDANELIGELHKDPLTGVFNKKTITEYATQKLLEERNDNVVLVIMDVDHFKMVNDTYGHMYGDQVLARVGELLKRIVAEDGVVGRFGGDEFMLVLTGIRGVQELRGMLRTIRDQIKLEFSKDFEGLSITCSMGAAISPKSGKTFEELFSKADFCLYISKEKGRDRYVYYREDMHTDDYMEFKSKKDNVGKSDGREMKELRYMAQFGQHVLVDKDGAIRELMDHMINTYKLDNITVFYGDYLGTQVIMGTPLKDGEDAMYAREECFSRLLQNGTYVKADFINNVDPEMREFSDEMKRRGIGSTLQCVIGTPNNIKGLLTLNRTTSAAKWAEYEVNCAVMLAAYLSALMTGEKQ
jgi:diguanylate cyclase (GGDEF)-like protein